MMVAILFAIIAVQALLLMVTLSAQRPVQDLITDLQTIIIIFVFVLFIYLIVIYNYIPYKLHKALKEVRAQIDEISNGNYNLDFDSSLYDQDSDIQELLLSLKKMLGIIIRFDQVKADKIFEHHQRINQLINLLPQAVLITGINGDVIYCNDSFRRAYPSISEMSNLSEMIFKDEFNRKVFDSILEALRYGNNLADTLIKEETGSRAVSIDGSIIRNRKGVGTGSVFVMDFRGDK